jgi:transposase InsO family protein
MLALCHNWFAFHGVPEFILSDRGKEFMGIVTTLCTAANIKQIHTTPGHPQANGLCEVQPKTLTREL